MNEALLDLLVRHALSHIRKAERQIILDLASWYDLNDEDLRILHDAVWKKLREN